MKLENLAKWTSQEAASRLSGLVCLKTERTAKWPSTWNWESTGRGQGQTDNGVHVRECQIMQAL